MLWWREEEDPGVHGVHDVSWCRGLALESGRASMLCFSWPSLSLLFLFLRECPRGGIEWNAPPPAFYRLSS